MKRLGAAAALIAGLLVQPLCGAQEDLNVLQGWARDVPAAEMMKQYLTGIAGGYSAQRQERYEAVKTPEEIAAYQAGLREEFIQRLGGFPERTPLNAQVTSKIQAEDYTVEKVIFESRPGHFVTAALYLPNSPAPFPAVLVPCGHEDPAKAEDSYQRVCILLVKNGIAVFCYDPIGQGERSVMFKEDGTPWSSTIQHTIMGVGAILTGANIAQYSIWDGMRALDYLETRPEIDKSKLGCTGNSGGGTQTSYIMALDPRVQVAAPSCYITSWPRLLATIGPQDGEQTIFGQVAIGLDHAEFLHLRAPRPTLILSATHDFFDIQGTWDSFRQAKRMYGRLGVPQQVDLVETDAGHGYGQPSREAMVRWMRRWFLGDDRPVQEPEFAVHSVEELRCTPDGKTMNLPGAKSPFDLNLEQAAAYAGQRDQLWAGDRTQALAKVRELAGIKDAQELAKPAREWAGVIAREGYQIRKLILYPEAGIALPALHFVPAQPPSGAVLYVNEAGATADAAPGGAIEALVKQGKQVLAVDLRGFGETASAEYPEGDWTQVGPDWPDTSRAYVNGLSYVGMRANDVLSCITYLESESSQPVEIVAVEEATVPALHAAALLPEKVAHLTLRRGIPSWQAVLEAQRAGDQWSSAVHGALQWYDLPQLAGTLPAEKLTQEEMAVPAF